MSSTPPEGGRRARLAAERQARATPAPDAEVLDSRRSRRAANRAASEVNAPEPQTYQPPAGASLFAQAEHFWTEPATPRAAPVSPPQPTYPTPYRPAGPQPTAPSYTDPLSSPYLSSDPLTTPYLPSPPQHQPAGPSSYLSSGPMPTQHLSPAPMPVDHRPTDHMLTGPFAPDVPRSAPLTRRELAQRSGRRSATPQVEPAGNQVDESDPGSFKALLPPADGFPMHNPRTGSLPVAHRTPHPAPGLSPSGPSTSGVGSTGPSTTELEVIRGRRAARPQTSRRRAELALGRSVSNRRVWGGVLAVAMVLVVPGASMLQRSVTVNDGGLSGGGNLAAIENFPDSTRLAQPEVAETTAAARARAKAKAAATTVASEAAKATAGANTGKTTDKKSTGKAPSSGNTGRITNELSGLPWASGVFSRGQGVDGVQKFGDWRGAAVDVVIDWPARQSWDDIVNPDWLYSTWKNTPYTKVFGVAPVPEADGSATMAGCAAGSYNDKWRQFAENIKAAGLDDETVIRLGWEFNGDWYKWQASDPKQFAECWRQIVRTAESVAPALLWDWNVNRGKGASVVDAREAYPGDAYVDIVGVDSYDMWPGVTTEADWNRQYAGPYGLKFWSDFAKEHGKRISVAEWGVYPGPASGGSNGGDNAFYITKMQGFFKSQGSHLAYEAYFNESASYVAGSLFSPTQNPDAAARYKSLFGS
jgi:beta-mannanase